MSERSHPNSAKGSVYLLSINADKSDQFIKDWEDKNISFQNYSFALQGVPLCEVDSFLDVLTINTKENALQLEKEGLTQNESNDVKNNTFYELTHGDMLVSFNAKLQKTIICFLVEKAKIPKNLERVICLTMLSECYYNKEKANNVEFGFFVDKNKKLVDAFWSL